MMNRSEQAQERDAELYSLLHRGNSGDVEFYLQFCRGARRVLELGSGYGRVAVPLAVAGHHVTGLELHPGLLDMAREYARREQVTERFRGLLQDMRSFELPEPFDRIIIPYSGLFCLLGEGDVEACLRRCRQHLAPGGRLAFDVYEADSFHTECTPEDVDETELEPVVAITHRSSPLMVFERSSWDKPRQRLHVAYEFHDQRGVIVHRSTIVQRYRLVSQLQRSLRGAGFASTSVHGGFQGEPVSGLADAVVFHAQI